MCIYLSLYIYIYIYSEALLVLAGALATLAIAPPLAESRKEPIRFDSFRFRNFRKQHCLGSVRFGNCMFGVPCGSGTTCLTLLV